jgi:hypothetical protein
VAFALVAVAVAFGLATFTGAAPAPPIDKLGLTGTNKRPDAFPTGLGPALVDAVYWAGPAAGTADDVLWLVFNDAVLPGSYTADDLLIFRGANPPVTISGLSFAQHEANADAPTLNMYRNVLAVTGLNGTVPNPGLTTALTTADKVALRNPKDHLGYRDASRIRVNTGPAITKVEVTNGTEDGMGTTVGDVVRVYFTHQITTAIAAGANARTYFSAPEIGTTGTAPVINGFVVNNRFVDITFNNDTDQGKIREGITSLRLTGAGVLSGRRSGAATTPVQASTSLRWEVSQNEGPILLQAGFDATTNRVTLVFSDDIQDGVFTPPGAGVFAFSGASTYTSIGSDDGDNVLRLEGIAGGSPVGQTVTVATPAAIQDFQNWSAQAGPTVTVVASPIIILANYRDSGTDALTDDRINVWFDVDFAAAPGAANFGMKGMSPAGVTVTLPGTGPQVQISDLPETWTQGDRIFLNSIPIAYASGANVAPSTQNSWVRDFSPPRKLILAADPGLTYDSNDTAFVGYDETGTDDATYTLFYARRSLPVDAQYITDNVAYAEVLTNPTMLALDSDLITTYLINTGDTDTKGEALAQGDDVYFAGVVVDLEGNYDPANLRSLGRLVAGPLSPPVDFVEGVDDDMIHIFGIQHPSVGDGLHLAGGDPGSAPVDADSVRVYADTDGDGLVGQSDGDGGWILLGSGLVDHTAGVDGSFGPIALNPINTGYNVLYFVSTQGAGVLTVESFFSTPIINDNGLERISSAYDPTNADRIYSGGDTLRVGAVVYDPTVAISDSFNGVISVVNANAVNNLLYIWADLTGYVTTTGADSVLMTSLGANLVDDDNDWIDSDVDGIKDYPEPYVDENGNGGWDPGETFLDRNADKLYTGGDANLDCNDAQELSRYGLLGYYLDPTKLVADPEGVDNFAVLEDLPVVLTVEDNAVRSNRNYNAAWDSGTASTVYADFINKITEGKAASYPLPLHAHVPSWSMEHRLVDDESFLGTEDSQAPTVSEISFLARESSWTSSGSANIIEPGDHVYKLPAGEVSPFFNLADSTLSDDDVIFVALQIDPTPNTSSDADWQWLSFDRTGDANADGYPGIRNVLGVTNGDDDNDGFADLLDPQVANAIEADANADALVNGGNGDGIHRLNDRIDNDNDAFFRINGVSGGYLWFNIDESDTNGVDDDGNGVIDDASEVETYTAASDDDEDGIVDASSVAIDVDSGKLMSDLTYTSYIYVAGFSDPTAIAKYKGTPAASKPKDLNLTGDDLTDNDGVFGNKDRNSAVTKGSDNLAHSDFAFGAPNLISYSNSTNSGGLAPWVPLNNSGTAFAFNYRTENERNLNMKVIKSLYGLADGAEYRIRAVAFDHAYQGNPNWAVPLRFSIDSVAPIATIPPPPFDGVADTNPDAPGTQVCDVIATDNDEDGFQDAATYTLEANITGDINDVDDVEFQFWNGVAWEALGTDTSAPFTWDWTTDGPMTNDPPAAQDTLYFRTIATDLFGNVEPQSLCDSLFVSPGVLDATCYELQLIIVDCTPPMACLCQIGSDYDPSDGAFVPLESAVDISACFTDGDDDETTNDVVRVEFEYRLVGTTTWLKLVSITGVPADTSGDGIPDVLDDPTGIKHPIIATGDDYWVATVTWDTRGFAAGSYDLRATAYDIEGNGMPNMTCTATATLDNVGLRAYIQPCVNVAGNVDSLFANVYIHDLAVNKVEFQYTADANSDGLPDGGPWITIGVDGIVPDKRGYKGDVILRAGTGAERVLKNAPARPLDAAISAKWYRYWDIDGDGYNPVDPIVRDVNNNGTFQPATDVIIVATQSGLSPGAVLTTFAADEYIGDVNNNNAFDLADWILKDNPADGADDDLDLWAMDWDVTGLSGCYIVRAVATDVLGNVDDDAPPPNGIPDTNTNIWFEQCCIDSEAPEFCVTSYIPAAGGAPVVLPPGPPCLHVFPQDFLTLIAAPLGGASDADVDSVRFYYGLNTTSGFEWVYISTDMVRVDGWTAKFMYGDLALSTDTETNFRAVAYDKNGNFDIDPDACKACVVLGENVGPETDIVMVVTADVDTLEANTVLRGNLETYCLEPTTLSMLVTAEDNTNITKVEIWYRKAGGAAPYDTTAWMAVPGMVDTTYPYIFGDLDGAAGPNPPGDAPAWNIAGLTDGVYQFFPRATDANGNLTPIFGNPYRFSLNRQTAHVTAVEKLGVAATSLTPGEEAVIKGDVDVLGDYSGITVEFYYAERVVGEILEVAETYPYGATTNHSIWAAGVAGEHGSETVKVGGVVATWYSPADFAALVAPTKLDYTITGSTSLKFGSGMGVDDVVTIDYNVTNCQRINTGDNENPYSVAWDADSGSLVPMPSYSDVTHYDIIAVAYRVWMPVFINSRPCSEPCYTEGFTLPINDTDAPEFSVYGLDFRNPDYPGNPLCPTCGGSDLTEETYYTGSCKSKHTGIEHQFVVTTEDDVNRVYMQIAGGAPIDFTHYTAEDDSLITIPITFYIDDLANVVANSWNSQAVNPDSVENVTITISGIDVYNTEMTNLGDGIYQYNAVLPLGGSYGYSFSVDMVGDDQVSGISDPRFEPSTITLQSDLWMYSTSDLNTLFGVNMLKQVLVTVVDEAGNSSTNLISGGGQGGALGQIWVTYDPTRPVVNSIWLSESMVAPTGDVNLNVEIRDPVPATGDIVKLTGIILQASVDDTETRWRTVFEDGWDSWKIMFFNLGGGWGGTFSLPGWMNPLTDGIDNNRDGVTDDSAESVYTYKLRVVAIDDCYNWGYSCGHPRAQSPEVCGEITVDADLPQACITEPTDGMIFPIGDVVTLTATTTDTDVAYVQFEYSTDGGSTWNTIDCTPLNDDDDPWVEVAAENGTYNCSWDTGFLAATLASDFYVSLRARAFDTVGNDQADDPALNCNVNILMNDTTGPVAMIARFCAPCFPDASFIDDHCKKPFDPTLALSGEIGIFGIATGWNGFDVATVIVQYATSKTGPWTTIDVDHDFMVLPGPALAQWDVVWDTDPIAAGTYYVRAYATDADGNVQSDTNGDGVPEDVPSFPVVIDHIAPDFMLTRVGPEGVGGTTLEDHDVIRADLLPAETAICPEHSPAITFYASVTDPANDTEVVNEMWLEFLDDFSNPENPTWISLSEEFGFFQYRDAVGNNLNPDGKWQLVIPSLDALADEMSDLMPRGSAVFAGGMAAKEYRFRVRAVDYACNTNEANEGVLLRVDPYSPNLLYLYAGDRQFEAGAGTEPVHVAGGDTVPLAVRINDGLWYSYGNWPTIDYQDFQDQSSGIYAVQFAYYDGDGNRNILGLGTLDDAGTSTDEDDLWKIDWVTPANLPTSTDSVYTVEVVARDNAGNCSGIISFDAVVVQDHTPPQDTKLIAVASGREDDCATYPRTSLDYLLPELPKPIQGAASDQIGYMMGIDDNVLAQDLTGTKALGTVAREINLYASTPQGDASMLGGRVFFEARRVDPGKPNATGPWILLDEGTCFANCGGEILVDLAPGVAGAAGTHLGPIWSGSWNTLAQYPDGSYIWYNDAVDGNSVQIRVRSVDVWGNEEVSINDAIYHLIVDNTAPKMAIALKNAKTGAVVTQVERNSLDGVLIEATGGGSVLVNDDLTVYYYYKLATDLNELGSWVALDEDYGVPPTNDNPDYTRPYAFHWNTNEYRDADGEPLIPNETYNISVEVLDKVCNQTDVVEHFTAGGTAPVKFVDTIAPKASIVHIVRDYSGAECSLDENRNIENPENIRVNGVSQIWARILDGATDTQDMKFYYRKTGTSTWTMINADVEMKDLDNIQTWKIYSWATAPLAEGTYDLVAIATDDAGNSDPLATAAVTHVIIDRTGAAFAAVNPVDNKVLVPENVGDVVCSPDKRVADLIATSSDTDVAYKNSWENCLSWQWKWSDKEDVDDNWNSFGSMTMFDGKTTRFSSTVDLLDEFGVTGALVDWRLVATDVAGNTTRNVLAKRTVVDNVDPNLEVTHVAKNAVDTTIDPIDNDQITDVSAGDQVRIYATVNDDEPNIPNTAVGGKDLTDVKEVQFFVAAEPAGEVAPSWRFLGTAGYDATLGLWGILWNTSGLADGDYLLMARATDTAANCGDSHNIVTVTVENVAVPLAQVSAFNPHFKDLITKGIIDRVYGLTFGEKEAATVFFQYRKVTDAEWTTIGTSTATDEGLDVNPNAPSGWLKPQDLWFAELVTSTFSAGQLLELRAVASDEIPSLPTKPEDGALAMKKGVIGQGGLTPADGDPNIFSGLYDLPNTPVLTVRVDRTEDGGTVFTPVDNLGYLVAPKFFMTGNVGSYCSGGENAGIGTLPLADSEDTGGRVEAGTTDATLAPFVVMVAEDGTGAIDEYVPEMNTKIDNNKVWVGELPTLSGAFQGVDPTEGAKVGLYVSASKKRTSGDAPAPKTEMKMMTLYFYQTTEDRGTNGVAGVDGRGYLAADGYPTDDFAMEIPAGAVSSDRGFLIKRTDRPVTPEWQDKYIQVVGPTYLSTLHMSDWDVTMRDTDFGWQGKGWIRYKESDLVKAGGGSFDESKLSVRWWNGDQWTREDVSHIQVDTQANVIRFNTMEVSGTVWSVVATDEKAPVEVSMSPEWNGYTDQDPILRGVIRTSSDEIDTDSFELYIDNKLVYSSYSDWFMYPGSEFDWDYVTNDDQTIAWDYRHSCVNNDALKDGMHTFRFEFQDENEFSVYGADYTYEFWVDRTAPYVEFHGGFVGNPKLETVAGYINLEEAALSVRLFDGGSGILFKEDRIDDIALDHDYKDDSCEEETAQALCERYGDIFNLYGILCDDSKLMFGDEGFKYDVWTINEAGGENLGHPDDIETRTLIYTGTASALEPYVTPSLSEYTPEDTLNVPLAVLTGGKTIENGTVMEITLYTHRLVLDPLAYHLDDASLLDLIKFFLGIGAPVNKTYEVGSETPIYVVYLTGPMDNVFNAGSRFVEQRFIVDTAAPEVFPSSPGVVCDGATPDPIGQTDRYVFSASFRDEGVGIDVASIQVRVTDPMGALVGTNNIQNKDVTENGISFAITNEGNLLNTGTYFVQLSGEDKLGNKFSTVCSFTVGGGVIQVMDSKVIPNPYNPLTGNATISFTLNKPADVEVTIYDWAGDYVATAFKGTKGVGPVMIEWGGQTDDGRALGNGMYIVRIVVDDGSRQEPRVMKLAIWNER